MKNLFKYFVLITFIISTNLLSQEDPYQSFAEVMPEPIGGFESIAKKVVYPSVAKQAGLEGKVYVLVFINEAGKVDNVKIIKGIGGGCDEAAMDAVRQTKFSPGKSQNNSIKTKLTIPITFRLKG